MQVLGSGTKRRAYCSICKLTYLGLIWVKYTDVQNSIPVLLYFSFISDSIFYDWLFQSYSKSLSCVSSRFSSRQMIVFHILLSKLTVSDPLYQELLHKWYARESASGSTRVLILLRREATAGITTWNNQPLYRMPVNWRSFVMPFQYTLCRALPRCMFLTSKSLVMSFKRNDNLRDITIIISTLIVIVVVIVMKNEV